MKKDERLDGRGRWVHAGRRGLALTRIAATLVVVLAAYVAGAAETVGIRWAALGLTLFGIALLGLLLRHHLRREKRRDDTDHQRLRQQLEVSNARLNLALRAAQMGTWAWDADSDDLDLDAFERQLFGLDDRPYKASVLARHVHPEDIEPLREAVRNALRNGTAVDYEFRAPDGGGGWHWVEGSAIRHSMPGKPTYLIGVNRDITQRKRQALELAQAKHYADRALAALVQSRADLELALRSGRLGVWHSEVRGADSADHPGQLGLEQPVDWDVNTRCIFGRGPDEPVTRRHYFEALHPEDRERVLAGLARSRGGEYTDQYRIVHPDGQVRMIAVYAASPTMRVDPDTDETVYSMTGIVRDITDEENLKADLRQKAYEAQLATEAKARFLAMMSHEIRTPMNGVVGMIELLLDTPVNAEQQQMLKTCKDSAFVLLTVINDVLDFSKIEAGKLELDYMRLSPRRLVEGVGEALGTHASQRSIDLDIDVSAEVPRRVVGDRVRLRQILTNLVSNAIKFTERGGVVVTVSLDRRAPGDDRPHMRFDIVDSGIGMDEDTARGLFQPFQQADATTTRRFGGTGLGLSIVKHLTELMGGRVECESRLAQGSRFSVVIPLESAPVESAEHDWGYPIAGVRVLALASRDLRRRILSDFMTQFGAGIEFFDSGDALFAQAQKNAARRRVDLVLLDRGWSISECAGVRRRFSETPELAGLPFLVVRTDEPVQEQSIPDAVLVNGNPLTRTNLIHGIAAALGWGSAPVPAIALDQHDASVEPVSRAREEAAGRLILLAEDNSTNREVISRQLARLGYACDVAEDGVQAWSMLRSGGTRYAMLLTDCHMPRLDGYELTRWVRGHERDSGAPALPIIAITANALQGEGERCLALGMSGYLAKPVHARELKQVMTEFLPPTPAPEPVVSDPLAGDEAMRFRELAEILGHDETKLRHVLGVFLRSTRHDCDLLDTAHAAGDWHRVRELAHKLRSGCHQLGEEVAATSLEAVERGVKDEAELAGKFVIARDELHLVLMRVSAYLDTSGASNR